MTFLARFDVEQTDVAVRLAVAATHWREVERARHVTRAHRPSFVVQRARVRRRAHVIGARICDVNKQDKLWRKRTNLRRKQQICDARKQICDAQASKSVTHTQASKPDNCHIHLHEHARLEKTTGISYI